MTNLHIQSEWETERDSEWERKWSEYERIECDVLVHAYFWTTILIVLNCCEAAVIRRTTFCWCHVGTRVYTTMCHLSRSLSGTHTNAHRSSTLTIVVNYMHKGSCAESFAQQQTSCLYELHMEQTSCIYYDIYETMVGVAAYGFRQRMRERDHRLRVRACRRNHSLPTQLNSNGEWRSTTQNVGDVICPLVMPLNSTEMRWVFPYNFQFRTHNRHTYAGVLFEYDIKIDSNGFSV